MGACKQYIGVKRIHARPMSLGEYNDYRGWQLPADEDPDALGYLVEYEDPEHPNHPNHIGYISWSPAKVFNEAYRETIGMSFGFALEAMRKGSRVARAGWNGAGIFIGLTEPGNQDYMTQPFFFIDTLRLASDNPVALRGRVPWIASQTDLQADDWGIV